MAEHPFRPNNFMDRQDVRSKGISPYLQHTMGNIDPSGLTNSHAIHSMPGRDGWKHQESYRENLGIFPVDNHPSYRDQRYNPAKPNSSENMDHFYAESRDAYSRSSATSKRGHHDPSMATKRDDVTDLKDTATVWSNPYITSSGHSRMTSKMHPAGSNGNGSKSTESDVLALVDAVKKKNQNDLDICLSRGTNVNSTILGYTALHVAADIGDLESIEKLLQNGADPSICDQHGKQPEALASRHKISILNIMCNIDLNKARKSNSKAMQHPWKPYSGEHPEIGAEGRLPGSFSSMMYSPQINPLPHFGSPQVYQDALKLIDSRHNSTILDGRNSHRPSPYNLTHYKMQRDSTQSQAKSYQETSYPYDHFPSPFEHMPRPSSSHSALASVLDKKKNQSKCNTFNSNQKPLKTSENPYANLSGATSNANGHYYPYMPGYEKKAISSSHESSLKRNPVTEPKSSFFIDDLTKRSNHRSSHTPLSTKKEPPGAGIPIDVTRIKSPFPNDFYRTPENTVNYPTASPMYYSMYTNTDHALQGMLYSSYLPGIGLSNFTGHDLAFNKQRQHDHLAMLPRPAIDYMQNSIPAEVEQKRPSTNAYKATKNEGGYHGSRSSGQYNPPSEQSYQRDKYIKTKPAQSNHFVGHHNKEKPRPHSHEKTPTHSNYSNNTVDALKQHSIPNHRSDQVKNEDQTVHVGSQDISNPTHNDSKRIQRQFSNDTDIRTYQDSNTSKNSAKLSVSCSNVEQLPISIKCTEVHNISKNTCSVIQRNDSPFSANVSNKVNQINKETLSEQPLPEIFESNSPQDIVPEKTNKTEKIVNLSEEPPNTSDVSSPEKHTGDTFQESYKEKKNRKRKMLQEKENSFTSDHSKSKKISSDNDQSSRREKRPKRSETEDDYYYHWDYEEFSSTEPENDNSSDEDFHCPVTNTIINRKLKTRKMLSRPSRHSPRQSFASEKLQESSTDETATKKHSDEKGRVDKKSLKDGASDLSISSCSYETEQSELTSNTSNTTKNLENVSQNKHVVVKKKTRRRKKVNQYDFSLKKKRKPKPNKEGKSSDMQSPSSKEKAGDGKHNKHNVLKRKYKKEKKFDSKTGETKQSPKPVSNMNIHYNPVPKDLPIPASDENLTSKVNSNKSLIELYTGTSSQAQNEASHNMDSYLEDQETLGNQLFANELTEAEQKALCETGNNFSESRFSDVANAERPPLEESHSKNVKIEDNTHHRNPLSASNSKGKIHHKKYRKKSKDSDKKPNEKISPTRNMTMPTSAIKHKTSKDQFRPNSTGRKGRPPGSQNKMKKNSNLLLYKEKKKKNSMNSTIEDSPLIAKVRASLLKEDIAPNLSWSQTSSLMSPESLLSTPAKHTDREEPKGSGIGTPKLDFRAHHRQSRSSTPLNFGKERKILFQTPLPSNMKKLTCNSAIGETMLHKAARLGYIENMQHYLENGCDVNIKDNAGYTPLHEVSVNNRWEAAKLLLQYGADVNINSTDGTRPIHDAVEYNHLEIIRLLLSCGADPLLSKFSGRSIHNMFRCKKIEQFMNRYLKKLQKLDENLVEDCDLEWSFQPSSIFEKDDVLVYNVLDKPPANQTGSSDIVFEMFEEPPIKTFLFQPSKTVSRSNYILLNDVLKKFKLSKGDFLLKYPVDVKTVRYGDLQAQISGNWVNDKYDLVLSNNDLVEVILSEKLAKYESTILKVLESGDVVPGLCENAHKTSPPVIPNDNGTRNLQPGCSYTTNNVDELQTTSVSESLNPPSERSGADGLHPESKGSECREQICEEAVQADPKPDVAVDFLPNKTEPIKSFSSPYIEPLDANVDNQLVNNSSMCAQNAVLLNSHLNHNSDSSVMQLLSNSRDKLCNEEFCVNKNMSLLS